MIDNDVAPVKHEKLLQEIDEFLELTGMGETYFGAKAVFNSALVGRLRKGRRCWPETEDAVRAFIKKEREGKKYSRQ